MLCWDSKFNCNAGFTAGKYHSADPLPDLEKSMWVEKDILKPRSNIPIFPTVNYVPIREVSSFGLEHRHVVQNPCKHWLTGQGDGCRQNAFSLISKSTLLQCYHTIWFFPQIRACTAQAFYDKQLKVITGYK